MGMWFRRALGGGVRAGARAVSLSCTRGERTSPRCRSSSCRPGMKPLSRLNASITKKAAHLLAQCTREASDHKSGCGRTVSTTCVQTGRCRRWVKIRGSIKNGKGGSSLDLMDILTSGLGTNFLIM